MKSNPSPSPSLSSPSESPFNSLLSSSSLSSRSKLRAQSFYHVGDTGYSPTLYSAIGKILSSPPSDGETGITCAAIPIGSYCPKWTMHLQHTDPEGAVGIAMDTGVKHGFGVHWGTWIMSEEPRELGRFCLRSDLQHPLILASFPYM